MSASAWRGICWSLVRWPKRSELFDAALSVASFGLGRPAPHPRRHRCERGFAREDDSSLETHFETALRLTVIRGLPESCPMKPRTLISPLFLATLLLAACGTAPTPTAGSSSSSHGRASVSPSPTSSSSTAANLYTFAPEPGSAAAGTVRVDASSNGVVLTATLHGLEPGGSYIVDADPLPCLLFVGGPSQSFPKAFVADSAGAATVAWTVPNGMDGNANVQALTSQGTYAVLACADLTQ